MNFLKVLLRAIDIRGKIVFESKISNTEYSLPTAALGGQGLYMLQIIQNDKVKNFRIVVTR